MKRPFLPLSLILIFGILIAYIFKVDLGLFMISILVFFAVFFILRKKKIGPSIAIYFLVYLLGVAGLYLADSQLDENILNRELEFVGQVISLDRLEEEYARYVLKIEGIEDRETFKKNRSRLMLTSDKKDLDIGDRIKVKTVVKLPDRNTNPGLFNYRNYLKGRGISYRAYAEEKDIEIFSRGGFNFRKKFNEKLGRSFSQLSPKNASFIRSMLAGKSTEMDMESLEEFRKLGLSHILAVSGLHLGIITGFLIFLLTKLGLDRKLVNLLAIGLVIFYSYLIGWPPSIVRSGIMLAIYLISINMKMYSDSINNLFFVSFVLLLVNPYILFSLGFQLSFLATLSIFTIVKKLSRYFKRTGKIEQGFLSILGVQLGLFPVQIYYFNYFNLLSLLVNLVIIPLIAFILPIAFFIFILPINFGFSIGLLSVLLDSLVDIMFFLISSLKSIGETGFTLGSFSPYEILAYYLILFALLNYRKWPRLEKSLQRLVVYYLLSIILINSFFIASNRDLKVHFIDVGQGDSILIQLEGKNYLIDTGGSVFGNFDVGKNILLPYLTKQGIRSIDGVFISHFDLDHGGNFQQLADALEVKNLFIAYESPENDLYLSIIDKCREKNIRVQKINRGDRLSLGKYSHIEGLYPPKDFRETRSENNNSMVVLVNYENFKLLFTGDIEEEAEDFLLAEGISQVDFLKVAHHGSKTSSKEAFIKKVSPREAFIQVGRNNSFSHPSDEVISRYKKLGVKINRTDKDGNISLILSGENYQIDKFIKEKYSIIEFIVYYRYTVLSFIVFIIISFILIKHYKSNEELEKIELQ